METINEELSYVPMYKSYIDAVAKLTPEDRLVIYEAIFEYGFTGIEPTFDNPYLEMGWNLVKPNLVNNINRMRKNKSAANGAKGGRPKKADITSQPKINLDTPKKTSNEVELKSEVVTPEIIKEAPQSMFGEQRDIFQELEEYNSESDYEPWIKDTYSNIIFKGFFIKEKHLGVWDLIQGYKGVMNKLNNYFTQIDFDLEMDRNYESYKDRVIEIN